MFGFSYFLDGRTQICQCSNRNARPSSYPGIDPAFHPASVVFETLSVVATSEFENPNPCRSASSRNQSIGSGRRISICRPLATRTRATRPSLAPSKSPHTSELAARTRRPTRTRSQSNACKTCRSSQRLREVFRFLRCCHSRPDHRARSLPIARPKRVSRLNPVRSRNHRFAYHELARCDRP